MSNLDLNLLKVLCTLIEVKNTRKASEILCISQPAVSRSLSRLRSHFNDELFIRTSHGLEPTSKTIEIAEKLPDAMHALIEAVQESQTFEPSEFHGQVTIAMNGFIAHWLAPPLINRIIKQAPNVEIHITNWEQSTPDLLLEGQAQLGVNYFPIELSKQLLQKKLGTDSFVVVSCKSHPIKAQQVIPEHFQKYPMASQLIPNWNELKNYTAESLKPFNINPKIQLRSSHLNIILGAIENTEMLLPCSKLLAQTLSDKYKVMPIDKQVEQPNGDFALVVANKFRRKPLLVWLQSCIAETVDEVLAQT